MSWWRFVVAQELRKIFAFRVDFWGTLIGQTLAQLFIAKSLWENIFESSGSKVMEGYTLPMMTLYYLIVPLGNRLIQGESTGFLAREIYDGSFNRYLIYPISFFQYKTLTYLTYSLFYSFQLLLIYLLFNTFFADGLSVPLITNLFLGLGLFLIASFTYGMMSMFLELISLWADNVWTLGVMLRFFCFFFGGSFVPIEFMPAWLQSALKFTPFPYMVSYPIRTIMGLTSTQEILTSIGALISWGLLIALFGRLLWNKGQYRYTGVGI